MAVVSISRIQVRRGKKFSDSGIPQLASGEFGWAVDSQELYIGNGSVAEGAPAVGNTQILTDKTNIFEVAGTYTYRSDIEYIQTGPTTNSPIERTLKERLDDRVSVRAFGATGDGTDQTAALQRAIDQLFLNSANKTNPASRVVLHMEPGTYAVSSTIYLPPHVTIRGAGSDKTVITSTVSGPVFRTVNSSSTPGSPADDSITTTNNQATRLHISGLSISVADRYSAFYLVNCTNSVFSDIKISGNWTSSSGAWEDSYAIRLDSLSQAVTCQNNRFDSVHVTGVYRAVASDYDIKNNHWNNCDFQQCGYGFVFGENTTLGNPGQATGPVNNTIQNSVFDTIDKHALWVGVGSGNLSKGNKYYAVGYDGGASTNVGNLYSVLRFDATKNRSQADWFERSELYGVDSRYFAGVPYISEVSGNAVFSDTTQRVITVSGNASKTDLLRVPLDGNRNFVLEYIYSSEQVDVVRSGKMHLTVDVEAETVIISDEHNYLGASQYQESLEITAELLDLDFDSTAETLALYYTNSILNDTGTFKYTLHYNG